MTRIKWAPQAIEDVEAIRAYVARDSAHYAEVPEVGDEALREVIHGNYRIVYRLRLDLVEIVTVFHGARLFRLG